MPLPITPLSRAASAFPPTAEVPDDLEDLLFGLDVDTPGGLVEQHNPRAGSQPFDKHHFLLIAPAEGSLPSKMFSPTVSSGIRPSSW
jgi:hypothetical protein